MIGTPVTAGEPRLTSMNPWLSLRLARSGKCLWGEVETKFNKVPFFLFKDKQSTTSPDGEVLETWTLTMSGQPIATMELTEDGEGFCGYFGLKALTILRTGTSRSGIAEYTLYDSMLPYDCLKRLQPKQPKEPTDADSLRATERPGGAATLAG